MLERRARDGSRTRMDRARTRDALLEWSCDAVKVSLANLRTFPFIAEREQAGSLKLHGVPLLDRRRAALHARRGGR